MQTIFGITLSNPMEKFTDHFDVELDDTRFCAVSKKVFHHEDDNLTFDYQYVVSIIDSDEFCNDDRRAILSLDLVPCFNSLHESKKNSVLSTCCIEADEVLATDISDYGLCVSFGCDELPIDDNYAFMDDERLNLIANVYETMDSLRGFYLDKSVNMIGTNGWDILNTAINNEDVFARLLLKNKSE